MQRVMFAKIELWVVLLCAVLAFVAMIFFGHLVLGAERSKDHKGLVNAVALDMAEVPHNLGVLLRPDLRLAAVSSRVFDGRETGWNFPSGTPPQGLDGYILFSRYDGVGMRNVVELLDLSTWKVVHRWMPDPGVLLAGVVHETPYADIANWNVTHFREIHPWMAANGDLIAKDHFSPLVRFDACGRRVWVEGKLYHHSTEVDADGNLWIPSVAEPHQVQGLPDRFFEDEIAEVSQDGKVLFQRSVTDLMLKSGFAQRIFGNGMYNDDPLHLNDIQPVLADGPYWKKGDVFLSLRNQSMIVLYRPSTDQIVWTRTGPWLSQHDVDILDDHRIAVYDNHVQDRGGEPFFEQGSSDIVVYDFRYDSVSHPFAPLMKAQNVRTNAAGLFTELPGGNALIEDVTAARFILAGPDGRMLGEYVNRGPSGIVYHLGWSRYVDRAYGDHALQQMEALNCDQ